MAGGELDFVRDGEVSSPYTLTRTSAIIYDPRSDTWSQAASMNTPREFAASSLMPDGRVLVAGGYSDPQFDTAEYSTEIFDPASNTWSPGPDLPSITAYWDPTQTVPVADPFITDAAGSLTVDGTFIWELGYSWGLPSEYNPDLFILDENACR